MTLPDLFDAHDAVALRAKYRVLKSWPELQIRALQLEREGSPPPGLRVPQAKLSRKSNQVARGRIRRFESFMPSQAVGLHAPVLFWDLPPHQPGRRCA
jgi:hypothetical protein